MERRKVLGLAGAGVAGVAAAGAGALALTHGDAGPAAVPGDLVAETGGAIPFYGVRQAGIITPAQDRLHFCAFDVITDDRAALVEMLQDWTAAAARMTQGRDAGTFGAVGGSLEAPPDDTGEALGLPASGLTLTIGFGPTLFRNAQGKDRFGIAAKRPAALADLPKFPRDTLEDAISGGDIGVQACAHDPQVAVHAIRNLARIGMGKVSVRWSQLGFGRTSSTSQTQTTPRNLFGFKDGTANVKAEERSTVDEHVWVQAADRPAWLAGGSYLVARRIRMIIENWDRVQLGEQEMLVGRSKGEGAPLSGGTEFTEPDFEATGATGAPLIDTNAHVRLAHHAANGGARMLRRGYNFVDGNDELGRLDAGLFFLSFQRSPEQFITVQRRLAADGLNEYLKHVGSAIFAVPGGIAEGEFVGQALFA